MLSSSSAFHSRVGKSFRDSQPPFLNISSVFFAFLCCSQPFLPQTPVLGLCKAACGVGHKLRSVVPGKGCRTAAQSHSKNLPTTLGFATALVGEKLFLGLSSLAVKWKIKNNYSKSLHLSGSDWWKHPSTTSEILRCYFAEVSGHIIEGTQRMHR